MCYNNASTKQTEKNVNVNFPTLAVSWTHRVHRPNYLALKTRYAFCFNSDICTTTCVFLLIFFFFGMPLTLSVILSDSGMSQITLGTLLSKILNPRLLCRL